ncbi:hypothetical protein [Micromonospora zhanjiangensis]|uniref:DUF3558 domain-containing protein n=1 Tax=Micromonospora zhanjiangensis TaxID=1522057 RepID=A0ABV8KNP3_9ACTN
MNPHRGRSLSTVAVLTALAVGGVAGCGAPATPAPAAGGAATDAPAPTDTAPDPTDASPSATATAPDPCALVSRQEAQRLAGTPLNAGNPVRDTCTYTGPVSGPTAQVEVFVGDGAKKYLDIERDLGHPLRPLAGIGDEAYAEDDAVFVGKSGTWVSIRLVRLNDPAQNRKPLEELARTVAGRF